MTDSPSPSSGHVGVRPRPSLVPPDDFDPEPKGTGARILIAIFVGVPFLALLAAVPLAWGWGLGWHDIVIGGVFYVVSGLGVTVGFHRYFTHRSFKAVPSVHIALAVAGSLAMEGPVLTWVANHRRHHKYSDREGDPHSPWGSAPTGRRWQRAWPTPTWAGTRPKPNIAAAVLPRLASRPGVLQGLCERSPC